MQVVFLTRLLCIRPFLLSLIPRDWQLYDSGVDIITFTSASTVEHFAAIVRKNDLNPLNLPKDPLFACIGPITSQAAKDAGFQNIVVAKEFTTDGLLEIHQTFGGLMTVVDVEIIVSRNL